jgi:hypothetical protein
VLLTRLRTVLAVAATTLSGCTTTVSLANGAWTADCINVSATYCEGVAASFIGGLGGMADRYRQASGGTIKVSLASTCPAPPTGSDARGCWRANAPIEGSRACMIIAGWADANGGALQFRQVGGDILNGSIVAPRPGSAPC